MNLVTRLFAGACLSAISLGAAAQTTSVYDQHETFAPLFYPAFGDEVRAADGTPDPVTGRTGLITRSKPRWTTRLMVFPVM